MYFIFEGVDGCGKGTIMKAVSKMLTEAGIVHILTKEPGGPVALLEELQDSSFPYGAPYPNFRKVCVDHPEIPQLVKRALFKADNIYNWLHTIKPELDKGHIVLSDRGWPSDLAYGDVLLDVTMQDLYHFNIALSQEQFKATNIICIEADAESRNKWHVKSNDMDNFHPDFYAKVSEAYSRLLHSYVPKDKQVTIQNNSTIESAATKAFEFILRQKSR